MHFLKRTVQITLIALITPIALGDVIPEPETVFYGKVLVRSGGQDHQLTGGALSWAIGKDEGRALVFDSQLESLASGRFSYQLKVPHEAAAVGLEASGLVVPLELNAKSHELLAITIDGRPATIVVPGDGLFSIEQARRAKTFRIDLRVDLDLADSDGDGTADWWEDANGFDSQLASDAGLDSDGDGLSNLAEFLAGSDPNGDNRRPELLTREFLAYADGITGIHLQSTDTDSLPEDIAYTLTSLPAEGMLILREPDGVVEVGTTITQAEINGGRLVYRYEGVEVERQEFGITLRDEDPDHEASAGTVGLELFRPSEGALETFSNDLDPESLAQQLRVRNYLLGRDADLTIWDFLDAPAGQQLDLSGSVLRHAITGGGQDDIFAGGEGNDVFVGSRGDDLLRGGDGADLFLYPSGEQGRDTISDFEISDGDVLDLTLVLEGDSLLASDYVALDGERLGVDRNGDGSGYTDLVLTLSGNSFESGDLRRLLDGGHLLLGGPNLPAVVTIEAVVATADENDPAAPGEFTITRSGPTNSELLVELHITGSATNGVDYSLVESLVRIPAGERVVSRTIVPHVDSITELEEVVEIRIAARADYETGEGALAQFSIIDLLPRITLESLVPLATVDPQSSGAFLINRSAVLDRSVLVRLRIAGTGRNGIDYELLSPFVNLPPWQTTAVIEVIPRASADSGGDESDTAQSVVLSIDENVAYRAGDPKGAQVIIVDHATTLEQHLAGAITTRERILDYAFLSPAGAPRTNSNGESLRLEFNRNWAATDLQYVVEVSDDLKTWQGGPEFVRDVTPLALLSGAVNRRVFESATPVHEKARSFMRVRLEQK